MKKSSIHLNAKHQINMSSKNKHIEFDLFITRIIIYLLVLRDIWTRSFGTKTQ